MTREVHPSTGMAPTQAAGLWCVLFGADRCPQNPRSLKCGAFQSNGDFFQMFVSNQNYPKSAQISLAAEVAPRAHAVGWEPVRAALSCPVALSHVQPSGSIQVLEILTLGSETEHFSSAPREHHRAGACRRRCRRTGGLYTAAPAR